MKFFRSPGAVAMATIVSIMLTMLTPLFATPVLAQATTGSIRGVISDQTGAVISGATVVAKNQATGVETPAFKSTSDGVYNIPNLIPGKYTLTVESSSFKRGVFTDIDVKLGQEVTVDVSLQPGGVTETVTVVASTEVVVQKETAQISTNFDSRQVADLPSNVAGAGIDTLALLVPGVSPGFGNVNNNGVSLSVNGNRARSNNFSIDGQDNNDLSIGGPSFFVSNQDSVQDFQIITNNFSAQFGRNQGAIVNIVTKAGTNEFHGTGFLFHRDRKLFDTLTNKERISTNPDGSRTNPEAPPLLYNVYGGTLGGPIIKDRAFFFGSYQGIRTRETFIARSGSLAILPADLPRLRSNLNGNPIAAAIADFSAFAVRDFGIVRPRTDLANPFDTITINGQVYRAAFVEREFEAPTATPSEQEEFSGRVDYKLSDKDNIWGRYLFQDGNFVNALGGSNGFTGDLPFRSQNLGVSWNRQVSNTAVNEFRFAYNRLFVDFGGGCEGLKGCIPSPSDVGTAFTNLSFGSLLGDATGASLQTIGGGTGFPQGRKVQTYQFTDNYSFTRGRHQVIAGADIRRINTDSTFLPGFNGQFNVSTATRLVNNSPFRVTLAVGEPTIAFNETHQFYYFQDDWKVRDNLTLNLGVRYEFVGQPINTLNELGVERESNPQTAIWRQNLPLEARTDPKIPADKNNWAPRLGFAYTPRFWKRVLGEDATVIRGGYSIAYDPGFGNIITNVQGSAPFTFNNLTSNPAVPTPGSPVLFPVPTGGLTGENVRAAAQRNNVIARNTFDPRLLSNRVIVDPNFRSPYSQQWSLGIQRQINNNNVVEVRYIGNHGVGLFQNANVNPRVDRLINGFTTAGFGTQVFTFPGFPNLVPQGVTPLVCADVAGTPDNEGICNGRLINAGRILSRQNSGQSVYHGLQTRYNGRLFKQLDVGAAYTLSKALDNASEVFFFNENSTAQNPFNITGLERGFSGFDRRHVLALNGIWTLPFFKDQNGVIGRLLGGWQINGTYNLGNGRRFTPVQNLNNLIPSYVDPLGGDILKPFNGNPSADPRSVGISQIDASLFAAIFGFASIPVTNQTGFYSLNELNRGRLVEVTRDQVRFIYNGPGAARIFGTPFGNVGRNSEIGPRLNQVNASVFKNTRINERITIQFRTEVFNLLNHPNPGFGLSGAVSGVTPDINLENAGILGTAFRDNTDIEYGRRIIQFGLKIIF
ncbi:MAG: carboxypeptidase regulatory-like domain-containing protein [Acidobacteriota bacterium]